jgi:carbamoyltransferase
MNVLGISGLEQAVPFKRKHWPNLVEREYRISQGHDAAAALVCDGQIVAAAAQERFDRKKQSARFPIDALHWCLEKAGLRLEDIDALAHGFDYAPYREVYSLDPVTKDYYDTVLSPEAFARNVNRDLKGFPLDRVYHVPHHVAHAASAFYTSGWDECLVVVVDAMGEAHGTSIFEARGGELNRITAFSAQDSIGIFYSLVTLHLGFDFNSDEYKIMGLAPYGDPARFRDFFAREVQLRDDGSIRIPMLRLNKTRDERENYLASRAYLEANLAPARAPSEGILDAHRDIAAALQECLNQVLLHLCGSAGQATGQTRLALAGGVALNCTANGHLLRSGLFDDLYVQPASGDDGTALGAALFLSAQDAFVPESRLPLSVVAPAGDDIGLGEVLSAPAVPNIRMPVPFLGPSYDDPAVKKALAAFSSQIAVQPFASLDETCAAAAQLIAQGRVLAWYRGAMEFGPRALGNRSILADPGHPEMRDRINAMVKKREAFRPFAPAVAQEEVGRWFDVPPNTRLPYMITIVDVREESRAALPAITHVNGSARVQTVSSADNPAFHLLLEKVGAATGRKMVLNTSFNVKGQPIVNTPTEAIETFLGTGLDRLFLENHLITRK